MNWTNIIHDEENISIQGTEKTSIQRYFDDVGAVYERNNNDYNIVYVPENRDKLISMNLKCVIKIAKSYMGCGLALEDLISAGNEGLCKAWEKYNPTRSKFAQQLIGQLDGMGDEIPHEWVVNNIMPVCEYGDPLKSYNKVFVKNAKSHYDKKWLTGWVERTIKNASFNSVAMIWVNAYIRQELTNNSRLIRKPATLIKKEKTGESQKEHIMDITQPVSNDGNSTMADVLYIPDDMESDMDINDRYNTLHNIISKLFVGIKLRDRRIVMKRFGIGFIRPFQPKEISETEHISVARVSQIINISMEKMRRNAESLGLDKNELYDIFEKSEDMCF
jgi:DNA-directed RNA polymerase sigma subunit (sigma70/sigma32)